MLSGTCHHTFFRALVLPGFAGLYWALLDFSGLCWPGLSFALPYTTCFNMLPQLKNLIALPVHLLRQVDPDPRLVDFYVGVMLQLFSTFFASFFDIVLDAFFS